MTPVLVSVAVLLWLAAIALVVHARTQRPPPPWEQERSVVEYLYGRRPS